MNAIVENKATRGAGNVWSKLLFVLSLCVAIAGVIQTMIWVNAIWVWQNGYILLYFIPTYALLAGFSALFVIFPIYLRWNKRQFLDLASLWIAGISLLILLAEFIALFFVHFEISSPA